MGWDCGFNYGGPMGSGTGAAVLVALARPFSSVRHTTPRALPGASRRITLLLIAALAAGCARSPSMPRFPKAPVVLVSIDTLRADHLPAYGYKGVETPHLDRFRKDAILFENAYSHVPLTLPSHASVFTGLLPFEHGVRDNLGYRLDAKAHPTLARLLKERGYVTGGAVSAWVMRGASGVADGFDFYEDRIVAPEGTDAAGRVQRRGDETASLARSWLEGVKERPFFLFFHVYEPHAPYEPIEPYKSRYSLAYDGEIAWSDAIVGGLLNDLRRMAVYDRAVIVVLSDHGEGLGEHGEEDHGILLYRWALQVPLLVKLPGSPQAGTVMSAPVELIDMLPTLASVLDVPVPGGLRGRSLFDPVRATERIYAETCYPRIHLGWSELRSLVDERYQYIEGTRRELYDIVQDPRQLADLVSTRGEVVRSRQKELAGFPAALIGPGEVGAEELERLAALGYLGGAVGAASGPPPDPRESIHVLRDVKAAFRLAAAGRDEEAVDTFRKILSQHPNLVDARYELAQTLARLGRYPEAYDAFKAALRTSPSLAGPIAIALGRVCLKMGRRDEAEASARIGLRGNAAQGHELLARIALARDDLAAAEREARAAKGDAGAELGAAVVLAEVAIRRERFADALAVIDEAKRTIREQRLTRVPDLDFLRGDALARLGRYAEAEAAFDEEIRAFPRNSQAYTRLAIVYGLQRRTVKEVDRLLEAMVAANPGRETLELAAKTLESMGDAQGARAWRRRSLSRTPGR
jgi:arylsulfatase A-like enzyme/Flp pilus assembly protein TadD